MADEQFSLFDAGSGPGDGAGADPSRVNFDAIPTNGAVPISPGIYPDLETLGTHCRGCQRCGLAATRTNVVVSRGSSTAPVLIIGEGPGQQEDEQGKPFVGKSGQLLEKILESVRFNTETDVYICNIVKCRPPENRVPTPVEVNACNGYLLEQIRLVDPKIILLTGATALK